MNTNFHTNLTPLNLHEMFKEVEVGVVIINFHKREILFMNKHFSKLAENRENQIIEELNREFLKGHFGNTPNTIESLDETTLGFSAYPLGDSVFIIFLKDISLKLFSNQNREDNHFYDILTSMIAEIAHEVGNPLTAVMTTIEVVRENFQIWEPDKTEFYLTQSLNEVDRLNNYLKKIRDFTKTRQIEIEEVDIRKLVKKLWINNSRKLKENSIDFTTHISSRTSVKTDEGILYQILLNLLYNSLDSIKNGGRIQIYTHSSSQHFVKLIYQNDGPPIPEENYLKIFLPFFSTKNSGTGIGLAVSQKYMTRMGGTIKVEKPDKGWNVKFSIQIPAHTPDL